MAYIIRSVKKYVFLRREPNSPMSNAPSLRIVKYDLRSKRKAGGSPFPNIGEMTTTRCYKCGLPKPKSLGVFCMLINQCLLTCDACMPEKKRKAVFFKASSLQ